MTALHRSFHFTQATDGREQTIFMRRNIYLRIHEPFFCNCPCPVDRKSKYLPPGNPYPFPADDHRRTAESLRQKTTGSSTAPSKLASSPFRPCPSPRSFLLLPSIQHQIPSFLPPYHDPFQNAARRSSCACDNRLRPSPDYSQGSLPLQVSILGFCHASETRLTTTIQLALTVRGSTSRVSHINPKVPLSPMAAEHD